MQTKLQPPASQTTRRPYAPPRLVVHGTVAAVTAGVGAGTTDGKSGSDVA
jgi:hypothetical protein